MTNLAPHKTTLGLQAYKLTVTKERKYKKRKN
jgi:hypothetical protein